MAISEARPRTTTPGLRGDATPPFVGRARERAWLGRCLEESLTGRPRVVFVSGEAGVGKTRLAREIEAMARGANMRVCRGRACEDLPLPYLPFLEILRDQLDEMPEAVRRALGDDAERLLAVVRGAPLPDATAAGVSAPGNAANIGLFVSLCRATVALAQLRPTLLLLDDLHWADEATLDQLTHLTFALADAEDPVSLVVLGLHRPPEPGRALDRAVARVVREPVCAALELGGLDESEVTDLVAGLGVPRPSRQLATEVRATTGGNPLFVEEMVRALLQRDWIEERGGFQVTRRPIDELELPASPAAAIAARSDALGEGCRAALTVAAFLGDRCSLPALAGASNLSEDELVELVEEAREHGLLRFDGEFVEFAHPLVRHVLHTGPGTARRQRLHASIAASLEQRHGHAAHDHAIEIAHHLMRAGAETEPARLVDYAQLAGDQAFARLAWADAARFYEASAAAAERSGDREPQSIAELHLRAGLSHYRNMDAGPASDHLDRAIATYRSCHDALGLAHALVERIRLQLTMGVRYEEAVERDLFDEALAALPEGEPALRGWLHAMLAEAHFNAREHEAAEANARRALGLGRTAGDVALCCQASNTLGVALMQQLRLEEAVEALRTGLAEAQGTEDEWIQGWPLQRIPIVLTWQGDLREAERTAHRACELSRHTQDWAEYSLAVATYVALSVVRGDLVVAEERAGECLAMARRSHYPWGAALSLGAIAGARALRGDYAGAVRAIELLVAPGEVFDDAGPALRFLAQIYRQLLAARQGTLAERELAVRFLVADPEAKPDPQMLSALCAGAETALRIGDVALAERCATPLARAAEGGVVLSTGWIFLLPRVLGAVAAARGDWSRAEACFDEAEAFASRSGSQAELGLTLLERARALGQRDAPGDRERAGELLHRARGLFEEVGMRAPEEEAIEHAARLGIRLEGSARYDAEREPELVVHDADPLAPERYTLMVSDMVGSTALIERLGEDRAQDLTHTHNAILRACLRAYRGREIQHTGDGMIAAFRSAASAARCAMALQEDFAQRNLRSPDVPIRVRIGLHAGEVRPEESRVFGAAVNATVRICGCADAGVILVSEAVREQLGEGPIRLRERGPAHLKGFHKPFRLHEVEWDRIHDAD